MAHEAMDQITWFSENLLDENFANFDLYVWDYDQTVSTSLQPESSQTPQFDANCFGIEAPEQLELVPELNFEPSSENNLTSYQTSIGLTESIQHRFTHAVTSDGLTGTVASRESTLYPAQSTRQRQALKRRKRNSLPANTPSPVPTSEAIHRCSRPGCNAAGFNTKGDLRKHIRQHPRPYNCTNCDWRFARDYDLQRHRKCIHGEGEPLYCSVAECSRSRYGTGQPFKRKDKLDEHYRNFHGNKEPATVERSLLHAMCESSDILDDVRISLRPQTSPIPPHSPAEIQDVRADHSFIQNNRRFCSSEQRIALLEQEIIDLRNQICNLKNNISAAP